MEQQVRQQLTQNRHPERRRMREVDRRLPPWRVDLLEVHFLVRSVQRSPVTQSTLQRPQLVLTELTRMALV